MNIVTSDTIKYSHSWALKKSTYNAVEPNVIFNFSYVKMRLQGKNVPLLLPQLLSSSRSLLASFWNGLMGDLDFCGESL